MASSSNNLKCPNMTLCSCMQLGLVRRPYQHWRSQSTPMNYHSEQKKGSPKGSLIRAIDLVTRQTTGIGLVCSAYPWYSLSTPCSITPQPGFLNYYQPTIRKWVRLWTDSSEEGKGTRQENESINVTLIKKLILTLLLYLNK